MWTHRYSPGAGAGVSSGVPEPVAANPNSTPPLGFRTNAAASRKPCSLARHLQAALHICYFNSKPALSLCPTKRSGRRMNKVSPEVFRGSLCTLAPKKHPKDLDSSSTLPLNTIHTQRFRVRVMLTHLLVRLWMLGVASAPQLQA